MAGLDLHAELGPLMAEATLHLEQRMEARHAELLDRINRPHARFQLLASGGGLEPGGGTRPLVADLGAPPGGQLWIPQFAEVFGADPFGAVIANVTAAIFVGPLPTGQLGIGPPVVGLDINGCRLTSLALPSTSQFPDKSPVYPNERLYGVLTGTGLVAGGLHYHILVGVLEVPQSDEALTW